MAQDESQESHPAGNARGNPPAQRRLMRAAPYLFPPLATEGRVGAALWSTKNLHAGFGLFFRGGRTQHREFWLRHERRKSGRRQRFWSHCAAPIRAPAREREIEIPALPPNRPMPGLQLIFEQN
jgi:hypothetical protein